MTLSKFELGIENAITESGIDGMSVKFSRLFEYFYYFALGQAFHISNRLPLTTGTTLILNNFK
jgi:hypothetical protein